jgi:hypothetical protein
MSTPIPSLFRIRQKFSRQLVADVADSLTRSLADSDWLRSIRPGVRIIVAVGSRGIPNYATVVRTLTHHLQDAGAEVKILPAMGSHGGGTGPGQARLLDTLGVSPATVGAPVIDTMEVEAIGETESGIPVLADRNLRQADGILLVNRIKHHTDFNGPFQSGLLKMIAVGFGRTDGAAQMHRFAVKYGYPRTIAEIARVCLEKLPILAGVAMIDSPAGGTAHLEAVPADQFESAEPRLLEIARAHGLRLPLDDLDALIVDEMGKDISGTGMDTKVIGRIMNRYEVDPETPRIARIFVRDLTPATGGNAIGIGLADFTTRRLVDKIDIAATRLNTVTAVAPEKGRIPLTFDTDREAIEAMLSTIGPTDAETVRLLRIRNTNRLAELLASPAALAGIDPERIEVVEGPNPMAFDPQDNLVPVW